jgi:bifunctional DNase/RNase
MFLEMKVHSVAVDPYSSVPIVMLKDLDEKKTLPIWIGALEANSITAGLDSKITSRPMTHDILKQVLVKSNIEVSRVEVTDIKNNVYYASIYFSSGEVSFKIDSRPSDAIAIALRAGAPIMVDEKVIENSQELHIKCVDVDSELDADELIEMLEELDIEDLGKYKM